ncbi:hypothetical protein A4A49_15877 [Nicotiana attenuata]|uniref:F-boxkelch-repeat protein n=1 Tax=Nicotiana attenuata TaxID=49451 RepID=A0A1J6IE67_NICAT|nr:hypothetical protein A4A49_15877 [Nicotiana attenuata]
MATFEAKGVIYFYSVAREDEWYRIDLESLPREKLRPIAGGFTLEEGTRWTVVGEDIYCTGGLRMDSDDAVSRKLHKYNTTKPNNSGWQTIPSSRKLGWCKPFVFGYEEKIYVVGGYRYSRDLSVNSSWTSWGEFYNLRTGTWHCLSAKVQPQYDYFGACPAVLMNKTTVVFYSLGDGSLLFLNAVSDTVHCEKHPNLKFGDQGCAFLVPDGLQGCQYLDLLTHVARFTQPLAYNSTLYWFSCDMCLYGYDIDKKRWFQSNSLQGDLPWSLTLHPRRLICIPILVDLCNGKFLVIAALDF